MTPPTLGQWWYGNVTTGVDHRAVIEAVQEDAGLSKHFAFMTLMSAGIAILGLLLSSPAVVIGAMLISPLMGPIIGFGFALSTFDSNELKRTGWALVIGVVLAVLFCASIVLISPLQSVTAEIAARTRPNLFDLLVALFSGLAGTYAMIRGRHGAIVGVAIATALMPPLAVMGFGLATANWQVLSGSTLLFFTNLMTIAAAAAILARLYGFATGLSPNQTRLQATLIVAAMIALGIPLALSLRQIAWEALSSREASTVIASNFPKTARVNDLAVNYHADPIEVSATVLTPEYRRVEDRLRNQLARTMGQPVLLSLDQIRTEDGAQSASATNASALQRQATKVAEQLALVAGVPVGNIVVDRAAHFASVRAAPLPGASLDAYLQLEKRVAATMPGWRINLIPPLMPLPNVVVTDGEVDPKSLETQVWAAKRQGLPVSVTGGSNQQADEVTQWLTNAGVQAVKGPSRGGEIAIRWRLPEDRSRN
ncbi:DUF389 domain-containing protein [Sphingomonas sabuli]|uniref:DUF389 domain-containing protein n=1 Tax=Sphingomonas sabuli TaxID=2764186 RepID=UPI001FE41119|nr:DUF389 domain-containing protein [Sphingomonas sabuli]